MAIEIGTRPCDDCAQSDRCREASLACQAFDRWVATGEMPAGLPRVPSRATYLAIALFDDPAARYRSERERQAREQRAERLAELRRQARRETAAHKRLVALGLAQPLTHAQRRRRRRALRRRRWKVDPSLRERYLKSKRDDAIRRARRFGVAPAGSAEERRHRGEAQRRRRQAERERAGRTMTGLEFSAIRRRLGLQVRVIAGVCGVSESAARQWRRHGPPAHIERWLRALADERAAVEREGAGVAPCYEEGRAPAASGYSQARAL